MGEHVFWSPQQNSRKPKIYPLSFADRDVRGPHPHLRGCFDYQHICGKIDHNSITLCFLQKLPHLPWTNHKINVSSTQRFGLRKRCPHHQLAIEIYFVVIVLNNSWHSESTVVLHRISKHQLNLLWGAHKSLRFWLFLAEVWIALQFTPIRPGQARVADKMGTFWQRLACCMCEKVDVLRSSQDILAISDLRPLTIFPSWENRFNQFPL